MFGSTWSATNWESVKLTTEAVRNESCQILTFWIAAMSPFRHVSSSHDRHLCSPPAPVCISLTTTPTDPIRKKLPSFSSYDFEVPFP